MPVTKNRTLGLVFEESSGDPPLEGPPTRAYIYLQQITPIRAEGFPKPVHKLTPVEYEPDTFDAHADRLIANIRELKKEARAKFARARPHGLAGLSNWRRTRQGSTDQ